MGISLLIMFIAMNMQLGFVTLLIAHTALCAPFVTVTVLARMVEFDEHLIEAARDLGASEARALWHVLLPLTAPAIAAAVANAVGVHCRRLPITAEQVFLALHGGRMRED